MKSLYIPATKSDRLQAAQLMTHPDTVHLGGNKSDELVLRYVAIKAILHDGADFSIGQDGNSTFVSVEVNRTGFFDCWFLPR